MRTIFKRLAPIKQRVIIITIIAAIIVILALGLGISLSIRSNDDVQEIFIKPAGAVVANGIECAEIGGNILKQNGSVADAAIATLFCEGIAAPQSCGLGGGFLLTIYTKATGRVETLNAREVAPKSSTTNMFENVTTVTGPLSIAVPGELKGYYELWQKYGKLPWKALLEPSIRLCREGHTVSKFLGDVLRTRVELIKSNPGLAEVYINPETNSVYLEGDRIKRLKLAETLTVISLEGADTIYNNGTIGRLLMNELKQLGAIITVEDLMDYKVSWAEPIGTTIFDNKTVYSVPLPGSGSLLAFILNVLNGYLESSLYPTSSYYQRIVETFKYAYALRTELGDPNYAENALKIVQNLTSLKYAQEIRSKINDIRTYQDFEHYGAEFSPAPEDHGTANVCVIAPNGDAITVTSTINTYFGSKIRSMSTGIILNDQMDDFSSPNVTNAYGIKPSPANYIEPGKRPLSSMTPTIIVDKNGDVQMSIGAAGGSKITTTVANIIIQHLLLKQTLPDALHEKRFHHQLSPMTVQIEEGLNPDIVLGLSNIGHIIETIKPSEGFVAVTAIARDIQNKSLLIPATDERRIGASVWLL